MTTSPDDRALGDAEHSMLVGLPTAGLLYLLFCRSPGVKDERRIVDQEGILPVTSETTDLVLTAARIRLGEGRWASAVAVHDGRIAAVGDEADVRGLVGSRTRVVHAPGG